MAKKKKIYIKFEMVGVLFFRAQSLSLYLDILRPSATYINRLSRSPISFFKVSRNNFVLNDVGPQ